MRSQQGSVRVRSMVLAGLACGAALALPGVAGATVTTIGGNPAATATFGPPGLCANAGGCLYAQEGSSAGAVKAPAAGTVVRWRVKGQNGTARLHVLYPAGAVNTPWYETARSPLVTLDGTVQTIELTTPLPIALGSYVGVEISNGASIATAPGANPLADAYAYWIPTIPDGGSATYSGFGQAFAAVNADVDDGVAAGGGGTPPPAGGGTPPPASGGNPPPSPPAADTTAPKLAISGQAFAGRTAVAKLSCPASETSCAWVATLTSAKPIAVGRSKAKIITLGVAKGTTAGGGASTPRITLSKSSRVLLKARGKIAAKLTVVVTDAAGNRGKSVATLTLKVPKRR